MSTLLLVIDMQNDFCNPAGALYVPSAEQDVTNLSAFIHRNLSKIDAVVLTQDWHNVLDISHPYYWADSCGIHPDPFTAISASDVEAGRWVPLYNASAAREYIRMLDEQGEYPHVIWPEHCIMGSVGAAFPYELLGSLVAWSRHGHAYQVYQKGTNPLTEHFGAFRANVPIDGAAETLFNGPLLAQLEASDAIFVAGEARSHCVANTIKQLLDYPHVLRKSTLLNDCTSSVAGFENLANEIYEQAVGLGLEIVDSTTVNL